MKKTIYLMGLIVVLLVFSMACAFYKSRQLHEGFYYRKSSIRWTYQDTQRFRRLGAYRLCGKTKKPLLAFNFLQ